MSSHHPHLGRPARPTMKDVASLAGVAIKTVSRVMNGEPTVALLHWEGSGDVGAVVRGNCYLVVHDSNLQLAAGDWVDVLPRRGIF